MTYTDMKKTFSQSLIDLVEQGHNIAVVDADLMRITGSKDFKERYPERYFNCGIAEADSVDTAAGLSLTGRTVFCTTFSSFMALRAADQVRNGVCYNDLNVKVCGIYAGITGEKNGGTHIPVEDVAIFRAMPGMRIVDPGDGNEFYQAMQQAALEPGPFYVRISKGPMQPVLPEGYQLQYGKGVVLSEGTDAALVTSGLTTGFGAAAVKALAEEGIKVRHIHLPYVKPLDEELIYVAAKETGKIFVAENHSVMGGLGGAVAEYISSVCPVPVIRIGVPDEFCVGAPVAYISRQYDMDAEGIAKTIREKL